MHHGSLLSCSVVVSPTRHGAETDRHAIVVDIVHVVLDCVHLFGEGFEVVTGVGATSLVLDAPVGTLHPRAGAAVAIPPVVRVIEFEAVSYTHLTLSTIYSV